MQIRFAERPDIEEIVNLCKLHAAFEKATYDEKNKADLLSKALFEGTNTLKCLVIVDTKKLVGYATFVKQFSTWNANYYLYLDCLFLLEESRGMGIGRRVLDFLRDYAIEQNCFNMEWQTPTFNENAISFYIKIGAVPKTKERFIWGF